MNNIVERLRQHALPDPHDEREVMHAPLLKEAADLIESLQARAKELEAELLSALAQAEHNGDELAALRKKIEDAPVVAYESSVSGDLTRKCYEDSDIELIRKEDLK